MTSEHHDTDRGTTPDARRETGEAHGPSRRAVLRVALVGMAGSALAGCTSADSSAPTSTPADVARTTATTRPDTATSTAAAAPAPTYSALARRLSGPLHRPGQQGWRPSRLLYNPRFDNQAPPAAIAACRNAADVAACVGFAAEGGAALRLRAGGHSYGGWSSGAGLVADLGAMNAVQIDVAARTATIGAGARLADVYSTVAKSGLSLGAGSCPSVGFTGLTLGGGIGVLAPSYGLTIDQVTAFRVVTADGRLRHVDAGSEPDLFWALRGGGGGLAAVTATSVRLRPAPSVDRFEFTWPLTDAVAVLGAWQRWVRRVPREIWSTCKLIVDPDGRQIVTVLGTWVGTRSVRPVLASLLRDVPSPSSDNRTSGNYRDAMFAEAGCTGLDATSCVSQALSPGYRVPFAATSSIVTSPLPSRGIEALVTALRRARTVPGLMEGGAAFDALGGAVADVAPNATAFPWRTALADVQYTATWSSQQARRDPAPFDAYVRSLRAAVSPWLGTSAYVNYADPSLRDFGVAYWGSNLPRLRSVKQRYDPHGVFDFPQSVPA